MKDHISVYGYHRKQKHIESIAKDGVAFANVISGSSYTGATTPVIHTGTLGPHTGGAQAKFGYPKYHDARARWIPGYRPHAPAL